MTGWAGKLIVALVAVLLSAVVLAAPGCGKDKPRDVAQRIEIGGEPYIAYPEEVVPQSMRPTDAGHPAWMTVLNIDTPFQATWVIIGFVGQLAYFGRMGVQWLVSEKKGESTVPPIFWWLSLIGATMLLTYGFWRQDVIIIIGQAFGWIVYTRNLMLLRRVKERQASIMADPAPEPELDDSRGRA
ncbi:MAG: lipid-A-disaccharide synthase N-terminal domain-containing protein [Phycisphaerales bacterium]|nr:lipid-A-disaccharide synthase N-terminal domain-containing protein [Phycisphaerales bacterium]